MADNKVLKNNNEIPQKLLDLIKAEDTALEIARICFDNEIKEDAKIRGISYQTGRVLVGDLQPGDFEKTLEEKIALSPFIASKITKEINESIFYPVKEDLAILYKTGALSSEDLPEISSEKSLEDNQQEKEKQENEDTYREPIE